jgi:DNA-binding NarL/FixJ family response regulator
MSIKVLIADDHPLVRDALADLLTQSDGIRVVGTCADGSEVIPAAARTRPDIVLMDLQMPTMGGLEATRALLAVQPHVRVVVLTGDCKIATACEARAAGAVGFLLKEEDPYALPEQIRAVAAGGTAWCKEADAFLRRTDGRPNGRGGG